MLTRADLLRSTALLAGAALAGRVVGVAPAARAQTTQQVTVAGARKVIGDLRRDKAFGNAQQLLRRARAVFIVPPPVNPITVSTAGSALMILIIRWRILSMA